MDESTRRATRQPDGRFASARRWSQVSSTALLSKFPRRQVGVEARTCGMNQVQCTVHSYIQTCSCLPRPGPGGINRQGAIPALMQRFISLWWSSRTRPPPSHGCVTATWGSAACSCTFMAHLHDSALAEDLASFAWGPPLLPKYPALRFPYRRLRRPGTDGTSFDPQVLGSPVSELAPFSAWLGRVIWKLSGMATYIKRASALSPYLVICTQI